MSNPTNPDPKTINSVITMAQGGITLDLIAAALDLTEHQIRDWIAAGYSNASPATAELAFGYRKAAALAEIDLMTKLRKHAASDASSAFKLAEMLERKRRHPAAE